MMKQRTMTLTLLSTLLLLAALMTGAWAADYTILTERETEYYGSTSYEDIYGSYNYGGINRIDHEIPELQYGATSSTQIGVMEKTLLQASVSGSSTGAVYGTTGSGDPLAIEISYPQVTVSQTLFTDASGLVRADGSVGTLYIPSLNITMQAYAGATNASMAKGLGHFSSTSGWDGNIGLCGHNRGAKYVIGSIKELDLGDTIRYTTSLGTRTYAVSFVGKISSSDWSYLSATTDNRITLITCVAGDSSLRWCVQAVEVK